MAARIDVEVEVVGVDTIQSVDADAFRALPDGTDFLLDFVSTSEELASVVARIRVSRGFVPSMIDRLQGS